VGKFGLVWFGVRGERKGLKPLYGVLKALWGSSVQKAQSWNDLGGEKRGGTFQ
jgi:hypothetical protein